MSEIFAPVPARERMRIEHFLGMLGDGGLGRVLEIGSRDGRVTQFLVDRADHVVALDLQRPSLDHARVEPVQGDVTALAFDDGSFDTVVCTEVLEHVPVPGLYAAGRELSRVVRGQLVVGVPFEQDITLGAMRCARCGALNPPWGHVNSFDEASLKAIFPRLRAVRTGFCGETLRTQTRMSAWIEHMLDHPNGVWDQEEPCISCGAALERPSVSRSRAMLARVPRVLNRAARAVRSPRPNWIHVVFAPQAQAASASR